MLEEFIAQEFHNGWIHYPQAWMHEAISDLIYMGRITYTLDEDTQQYGYKLLPQ